MIVLLTEDLTVDELVNSDALAAAPDMDEALAIVVEQHGEHARYVDVLDSGPGWLHLVVSEEDGNMWENLLAVVES